MRKVLVVVRAISAVLAWSLFFFWWKKVLGSTDLNQRTVFYSLLAIGLTLLAAILYSIIWILHNQRVAKRGQRGSVSFYKTPLFQRDAIGREIVMMPQNADRYDRVIRVRSTEKTKEFLADTEHQAVSG
ncbi:MAG TPA: hypothetical protein VFP40_08465 [Terriglobales bacterium]|nr:hypothetical protein [Terriglobales bacterium]